MMLYVEKNWWEIGVFSRTCEPRTSYIRSLGGLRSRRSQVRLLSGAPLLNSCFYRLLSQFPLQKSLKLLLSTGAKKRPKAPLYWWKIGGVGYVLATPCSSRVGAPCPICKRTHCCCVGGAS